MKRRLIPGIALAALLTCGLVSCNPTTDNPGGGTDNPGGGTDNPGGGTDNPGGSEVTEWSLENALADGELGYIVCVGEDGNPEAEDRTAGCIAALEEIAADGGFTATNLEQHTCLGSDGSSWSDQAAKEFVERAVTQYSGKLDFIVSNNDGMAVAASSAAGLLKGTPIIGFDALSSACDMIKEGTLAGSVSQNGDDQALTTLTVLANLLGGNSPVITADYGGRAELNLSELDDHVISTQLSAVTAANADTLRPGQYVSVSENANAKGKKLLVAEYSATDNFIQETYHQALQHYGEAMGYEITIIQGDGQNDTDLLERVRTMDTAQHFDAFALNIIAHSNYEQYLSIVGERPVVFFNRQPKTSDNSTVADISGLENVYYVGSSSTGQGDAQGQIIKDWYNAIK